MQFRSVQTRTVFLQVAFSADEGAAVLNVDSKMRGALFIISEGEGTNNPAAGLVTTHVHGLQLLSSLDLNHFCIT